MHLIDDGDYEQALQILNETLSIAPNFTEVINKIINKIAINKIFLTLSLLLVECIIDFKRLKTLC
jgi:hypothetical protein